MEILIQRRGVARAGTLLVITCLVLSFACSYTRQSEINLEMTSNTAGERPGSNGKLHGTVEGDPNTPLSQAPTVEESILKTDLANVSLIFASNGGYSAKRVEISEGAMMEVNAYFKAYLRYCLIENPKGPAHSANNLDDDRALLKKSMLAANAISKFEIDAPDGRRYVSSVEAQRLIEFIAKEAVKTWKSSKGT